MDSHVDVACSCTVLGVAALVSGAVVAKRLCSGYGETLAPLSDRVRATALPGELCRTLLLALEPVVRVAVKRGVRANLITIVSLVAGVGVGAALAFGHEGIAGLLFVIASCGDALDGLVARASHTESVSGALLDASVDRYGEFFAFGGLAIHFRSSEWLLALTLAALGGSFMVSYGSAQAEARHVAVPAGLMRRPERAVCLGLGLVIGPFVDGITVILAMVIIAVLANVSAVQRIRGIALAMRPARVTVAGRRSSSATANAAAVVTATVG